MSFDALSLKILTLETKNEIINKTIEKIIENREKEFAFIIRNENSQSVLYISVNPNFPCFFSSAQKKFNFSNYASNFSALLKKYLEGARITNSFIINSDRILVIELLKKDSFCEKKYSLIFEFMGKHSNAILYDGFLSREKTTLASVVGAYQNGENILDFIINPPKLNISALLSGEKNELSQLFQDNPKNFINKYNGLSPKLISLLKTTDNLLEIAAIFELNEHDEFMNLFASAASDNSRMPGGESACAYPSILASYKPGLYAEIKNKKGAAAETEQSFKYFIYPLDSINSNNSGQFKLIKQNDNLNDAYCSFFNEYNSRTLLNKIEQKINKLADIAAQKKNVYNDDFMESENYETYKTHGQLLLTALYQKSAESPNAGYNAAGIKNEIEISGEKIKLDCKLNISDNVQKYFKTYKRMQSKHAYAAKNLNKYEKLIEEIYDCRQSLTCGNFFEEPEKIISFTEKTITSIARVIFTGKKDLKKFTEEFGARVKHLKTQLKLKEISETSKMQAGNAAACDQTQYYRHFLSKDGLSIFVGKSDSGNDYVLSKIATQEDYWFHVKDFRGSSVILKTPKNISPDIIEKALEETALYAAYYSQGRSATKIFVSCAKRKHVKKVKRVAGKVTFTNETTILIDTKQLDAKFHNQ